MFSPYSSFISFSFSSSFFCFFLYCWFLIFESTCPFPATSKQKQELGTSHFWTREKLAEGQKVTSSTHPQQSDRMYLISFLVLIEVLAQRHTEVRILISRLVSEAWQKVDWTPSLSFWVSSVRAAFVVRQMLTQKGFQQPCPKTVTSVPVGLVRGQRDSASTYLPSSTTHTSSPTYPSLPSDRSREVMRESGISVFRQTSN